MIDVHIWWHCIGVFYLKYCLKFSFHYISFVFDPQEVVYGLPYICIWLIIFVFEWKIDKTFVFDKTKFSYSCWYLIKRIWSTTLVNMVQSLYRSMSAMAIYLRIFSWGCCILTFRKKPLSLDIAFAQNNFYKINHHPMNVRQNPGIL